MDGDHDPATRPRESGLAWLEFEGGPTVGRDAFALDACRRLRRSVFIDEQGVPEALEWDGLDPAARHFLAFSTEGTGCVSPAAFLRLEQALGTARMRRIDGHAKAERVAVRADARRCGVGRRLMQALEARARHEGLDAVVLHAQLTAIPFYESLGYTAHGEVFLDAGIDHRAMSKSLR